MQWFCEDECVMEMSSNNRDAHFQGLFVNKSLKHGVAKLGDAQQKEVQELNGGTLVNAWRMVVSFCLWKM